jgi:hypothetical protein
MMMGDGEHVNQVFNVGSMDDVGTRLKFLSELYELWQNGIDILDRYNRDTPFYAERRKELESATKLLYWHMTKDYGKEEEIDRKIVDSLPHFGDQIKD